MSAASRRPAVASGLAWFRRSFRMERVGRPIRRIGTTAFGADRRGVAVVEFAILLPVMITLCFSLAELCNAIENYRKVVLYARVVADLSGRTSTDSMTPIFGAAGNVLLPFDATTVEVKVSAIGVQKTGLLSYEGRVCSAAASANTTARAVKEKAGSNGMPDVPDAFKYDKAHYILAEVKMPYKPLVGSAIANQLFGANGLTFKKQLPWADRTDTEVILPGGKKCS